MIGAVQHIGAIVDRHAGVIWVLNPFYRDREVGLRPDPTEIVPGQRVLKDLRVVLQGGGLVLVGRLCEVFGKVLVRVVVLHAEPAELREVSLLQVGWPVTECPGIDGQDQGGVAAGFSAIDEAGRQFAIIGLVQLEETRRGSSVLSDLLHRSLGERRDPISGVLAWPSWRRTLFPHSLVQTVGSRLQRKFCLFRYRPGLYTEPVADRRPAQDGHQRAVTLPWPCPEVRGTGPGQHRDSQHRVAET